MGHKRSVNPGFQRQRLLRKSRLAPEHHQIRCQQRAGLANVKFREAAISHDADQCQSLSPISQPRLSHNLLPIPTAQAVEGVIFRPRNAAHACPCRPSSGSR